MCKTQNSLNLWILKLLLNSLFCFFFHYKKNIILPTFLFLLFCLIVIVNCWIRFMVALSHIHDFIKTCTHAQFQKKLTVHNFFYFHFYFADVQHSFIKYVLMVIRLLVMISFSIFSIHNNFHWFLLLFWCADQLIDFVIHRNMCTRFRN